MESRSYDARVAPRFRVNIDLRQLLQLRMKRVGLCFDQSHLLPHFSVSRPVMGRQQIFRSGIICSVGTGILSAQSKLRFVRYVTIRLMSRTQSR